MINEPVSALFEFSSESWGNSQHTHTAVWQYMRVEKRICFRVCLLASLCRGVVWVGSGKRKRARTAKTDTGAGVLRWLENQFDSDMHVSECSPVSSDEHP